MRLSTRLSLFFLGTLALLLVGFSATLYGSPRSTSTARPTSGWRRP